MTPRLLRDERACCATCCATTGRKPAPLRVLRELREVSLAHACAYVHAGACARIRARKKTSRNSRNTRNHAPLRAVVAQHVAQLAQQHQPTTTGRRMTKAGRQTMPQTAAIVDELRQVFGREAIDAAIAAGQRLRREYRAIQQQHGTGRADLWLRRQAMPMGAFHAVEGDLEVGQRLP